MSQVKKAELEVELEGEAETVTDSAGDDSVKDEEGPETECQSQADKGQSRRAEGS